MKLFQFMCTGCVKLKKNKCFGFGPIPELSHNLCSKSLKDFKIQSISGPSIWD